MLQGKELRGVYLKKLRTLEIYGCLEFTSTCKRSWKYARIMAILHCKFQVQNSLQLRLQVLANIYGRMMQILYVVGF